MVTPRRIVVVSVLLVLTIVGTFALRVVFSLANLFHESPVSVVRRQPSRRALSTISSRLFQR